MRLTALVAVPLLVLVASGAEAQERHQGFWISFGLGAGWDLDAQTGSDNTGGAVYLRLGGTVNPQLLIGGEAGGWVREQGGATITRGNATGSVIFYPSLEGGFFAKAGLGFGSTSIQTTVLGVTTTVSEEGLGATFGAGYDIKLGRNFYLTPNADILVQRIADATRKLFLVTVGATWH